MNKNIINALQYVKNTNGGATREHFIEDHEPVGDLLWNDLAVRGLARRNGEGIISLTTTGVAALEAGL